MHFFRRLKFWLHRPFPEDLAKFWFERGKRVGRLEILGHMDEVLRQAVQTDPQKVLLSARDRARMAALRKTLLQPMPIELPYPNRHPPAPDDQDTEESPAVKLRWVKQREK